jgi:hypothetical protein
MEFWGGGEVIHTALQAYRYFSVAAGFCYMVCLIQGFFYGLRSRRLQRMGSNVYEFSLLRVSGYIRMASLGLHREHNIH